MRKQQTELDEQSIDIINAVKAESARAGMTGKVLANGIGRDRNYIYERFRYEKPFDTDDLSAIAKCIGITVDLIFRSARIGSMIRKQEIAA